MFLARLAVKDVLGLRRRYSGLIVLIALAVTAVGGGLLLTGSAQAALKNNVGEGAAQRTISVGSSFGGARSALLDVPAVEAIRALPGVTQVDVSYTMGSALQVGGQPLGVALVPVRSTFPPPLVRQSRPVLYPLGPGEMVVPSEVEGVSLAGLLGRQVEVERSIALREGAARGKVERLTVVGLSDPAWQEDGQKAVYLDPDLAWRWYGQASPHGAVATIAEQGFREATVLTASAGQVDGVLRQIQARGLRATSVQQLSPALPDQLQLVRSLTRLMLVVLVLLSVVASAFLVRGLVFQRTREVGLLKALGYTGRAVWFVMASETVIVAWVGAVVGLVLATVVANTGRGLLPASALPLGTGRVLVPGLTLTVGTLAIAALVVLAGAALPLLRALRLDAARALRDWQ